MTTHSVTNGQTSSGITLSSGDFLLVSSGGTAVSTTVSSGGTEIVSSGGMANFTTISNGGSAVVSSGGTDTYTTLSYGGTEDVYSGGTTSFTTVSFGGTEDVYSGGTTSFTTVSGGTEYVYSGGTASFTVDEDAVRLQGGTAIYTTVSAGGVEFVSSGGRAISTTLSGGEFLNGIQLVDSGGTASFTTVSNHSYEQVGATGATFSTTISSGGSEYVVSAGTAVDTTVDSGGYQDVFRFQARTSGTTVSNGGTEYVYSRGRTSYTMVSSGGFEVISRRGIAISTTVGGGGYEVVYSGGTASDTVLDPGGQINVTDLSYTSGGSATVDSSDLLTVSVGDQTYTQQLSGDYTGATFSLSFGHFGGTEITNEAPCYRSGTRILTDRGEIAIEDLLVGDMVQTVLSETHTPIIWIGRRNVDCTRHPKPQRVWPVRVAAGAFGPGQPHTDLFLSPDHAVYVGEVLIPIRHLINGSTIAQMPMDHVTYYHLELPQHDVVLAQGLPAESFLDLKDGSNYVNRPGPTRLYPDYTARMWEAFGCARLIVTGPELTAAQALVERVAATRQAA